MTFHVCIEHWKLKFPWFQWHFRIYVSKCANFWNWHTLRNPLIFRILSAIYARRNDCFFSIFRRGCLARWPRNFNLNLQTPTFMNKTLYIFYQWIIIIAGCTNKIIVELFFIEYDVITFLLWWVIFRFRFRFRWPNWTCSL